MNPEERNTWVALIASLGVNSYFLGRIWTMFQDGTSTADNALQIWAQTLLWVVPVAIAANIGLTVLAAVVQAMVTGDERVIFLKDERDTQFEMFGLGATLACMILGFGGCMVALAMGYSGFIAFNMLYVAMFLGDLAGSLVKLGLYRSQ